MNLWKIFYAVWILYIYIYRNVCLSHVLPPRILIRNSFNLLLTRGALKKIQNQTRGKRKTRRSRRRFKVFDGFSSMGPEHYHRDFDRCRQISWWLEMGLSFEVFGVRYGCQQRDLWRNKESFDSALLEFDFECSQCRITNIQR